MGSPVAAKQLGAAGQATPTRSQCSTSSTATAFLDAARGSMSGFHLHPRGAHMPGHMRRLEDISAGSPATAFRPLEPPEFRRDFLSPLSPTSERADDFAPAFANLTVWTEATAHGAAFHAGFDKTQLYVTFLRCVVDELLPAQELRQRVDELEEYVAYLASEEAARDCSDGKRPRNGALTSRVQPRSYVHVKMPPVDRHLPMAALLSPRALRAIQHEPAAVRNEAAKRTLSPRSKGQKPFKQHESVPKPLRLVELSDHEEAILELALYFEESLPLLLIRESSVRKCATPCIVPPSTSASRTPGTPGAPSLTGRWTLLSSDDKRQTLKRIKRKLARREFFVSPSSTRAAVKSANGQRTPSHSSRHQSVVAGVMQVEADKPAGPRPHKLLLSSYFSLVVLCLHETVRRVGGFTQELAQFAWKVLCEDTLLLFELMFAEITEQQVRAQQELQALRDSKATLQHEIREVESEIQRLQAQNTRSLSVWNLVSEEMGHLEQEGRWHGHCKALILSCLRHLQTEANTPAWLLIPPTLSMGDNSGDDRVPLAVSAHERGRNGEGEGVEHDGEENIDTEAEEPDEDTPQGHSQQTVEEDSKRDSTVEVAQPPEAPEFSVKSPFYQQLSPGAALVHDRARAQLIYVAHLIILCRSFLHLHERRAVQDVMDSTALEHPATKDLSGRDFVGTQRSPRQPRHSQPRQFATASDPVDSTTVTNPIGAISLSELHTLREINEALRAIEVLYAETGTVQGKQAICQGDASVKDSSVWGFRRPHCQYKAVGTQFPVAGGSTPSRSFLRALTYCTMAATGISHEVAFLPTGATAIAVKPAIEATPATDNPTETAGGSGRRRGSVSFHASEPKESALPTQSLLRLHKAFRRLPTHMKRILLLPVLEADPFPPNSAFAVAPSLSKDEMMLKIHEIYALVVDNMHESTPSMSSTGTGTDLLPISLSKPSGPWTSESFVEFILAHFLESAGGDVSGSEREFVRFFASIQLFLSRTATSSVGGASTSGSSATKPLFGSNAVLAIAKETLQFFAVLTKLHQSGTNNAQRPVCARAFQVFFYCQRVLAHVTIEKKRLQGGADLGTDVWVLASGNTIEVSTGGACNQQTSHTTVVAPQFVLLESVRTLVLHLVSSSSASTPATSEAERAATLERHLKLLEERATSAIVALVTLVTPGEYYGIPGSQATEVSSGELTETQILPLDIAVVMIVKAWIEQQELIERKVATSFQAAITDGRGRLSFAEFAHVMSMGSGQNPPSAVVGSAFASPFGAAAIPGLLSPARLAQIYTTAKVEDSNGLHSSLQGAHWQSLVRAVMQELDFLALEERIVHVDFRSIQNALLTRLGHRNSHLRQLQSWLLASPSRVGTIAALRKTWGLHRKAMDESFELALQADNVLEGVRWGQSGRLRYNKVQEFLACGTATSLNVPTKPPGKRDQSTGEARPKNTHTVAPPGTSLSSRSGSKARGGKQQEELDLNTPEVAWKAYQYLQSDYSAASRFADQVRLKQQKRQRTQTPCSR